MTSEDSGFGSPSDAARAAGAGVAAYVVTWFAAAVVTSLALAAAAIEDTAEPWSSAITAPGQVVAMAFGSPLSVPFGDQDDLFGGSGSFDYRFVPVSVLLLALFVVVRLSRREHRRAAAATTRIAVTRAVATAVGFVATAWVVSFVVRPDVDGEATAAHVELLIWGVLALSTAAAWGLMPQLRRAIVQRMPAEGLDALRAVAAHVLAFSTLSVALLVGALVVGGSWGGVLVIPIALGNIVLAGLTFGHLGAYDAGAAFDGFGGSSTHVWLLSPDVPRIALALVVFAVVSTALSGVVLHGRSRGAARPRVATLWVIGAYGLLGLVVVVLGSMSLGDEVAGGAFGPAPWVVLVLAAWGALADGFARTVAGPVSRVLPDGLRSRAVGSLAGRGESTPPDAAPLPASTKRLLVVGGCGAALVVAGLVTVALLNSAKFGPEDEAVAFVEGLAAGSVDAPVPQDDDSQDALLDPEVTRTLGPVEDARVVDLERYVDSVSATVEYTLDGEPLTQDVELTRSGSRWGVFDRWKVVDSRLATLFVSAPGATSLSVNGITVDVDGLDEGASLSALPGEYEIEPSAGSTFLEFTPQTVVASDDGGDVSFEVRPSDRLADEVAEQADAYVADCISRTEAEPDGCPNQTFYSELTDIRWKLISGPSYAVESDYDGGWTFATEIPGRARITATEEPYFDGDTSAPYDEVVDIDFSGVVEIDGESVTVQVEDDYF